MTVDTDKLPAEVREQDLPVGGAIDGALPRLAVPTIPTGIAIVREAPAMKWTTFGGTQAQAAADFHIGEEPMRRRLIIRVAPSATAVSYLLVKSDVMGAGIPIGQGQSQVFNTSASMWVQAIGADLVWGFAAELDQG